jgi:hypothetical protein
MVHVRVESWTETSDVAIAPPFSTILNFTRSPIETPDGIPLQSSLASGKEESFQVNTCQMMLALVTISFPPGR